MISAQIQQNKNVQQFLYRSRDKFIQGIDTMANLLGQQIFLFAQQFLLIIYYINKQNQVGRMSLKDFTLLTKLGEGAYSSVYKVQRLADGKQYALKKVKLGNLSEKQIENAVNQVRILASISCKNVVSYKEAFLDGKNLCIVMQFADGGDLYQKITHHKKNKVQFTESQIWSVLIQITRGLKTLHNLKILHRDLKSANVFLTKQGIAKLGDMNVSKIAKNGLLYTQTGTPYYASPEVWKDQPYDSKSDIWSLGCVIYEMATLEPPFKADDMEGLFETVTSGVYTPISSNYSKQLSSIIKLLLQKNPTNRPSTDKLLNSSLLNKKSIQLNLGKNENVNTQLLKTIRVPKKINYLTDRLPKSNYQIQTSFDMMRDRRKTEAPPEARERQNTLPRLQGIARYNEQHERKKQKHTSKNEKRSKNSSMQVQGISKIVGNQIKIDLNREKNDIRKYLSRIHQIGNKPDTKQHIKAMQSVKK